MENKQVSYNIYIYKYLYFYRNQKCTKNSNDAPEWFHIFPDWKRKQLNDYLAKNEEAIHILSKQQNWITISPITRDRKHPLEKSKVMNDENHDKLIPKWMKIRPKNKKEDLFKSVGFWPVGEKSVKSMLLVDKDLNMKKKPEGYNPNRSIFSIQDFRHHVMTKKEHEYYDSLVNQKPTKFFDWDDGKKFNPKYKKDV